MNLISWPACLWGRHLLMLTPLLLFCLSGCTVTDPEYSQRLKHASTDDTGQEIVGIWVSKAKVLGIDDRHTLLIRPNGTGIYREQKRDTELKWRYEGTGNWQCEFIGAITKVRIRYDGQCLLMECRALGAAVHYVFVRADDETAVEEHLRTRQ